MPLVGVLFFAWEASLVLALFWIENLIIGVFNIVKMLTLTIKNRHPKGLFLSAFFLVHYGLFCSVHGSILWEILDLGDIHQVPYLADVPEGIASIFSDGAAVLISFIMLHGTALWLGIIGLTLSRLASFIENFILRGEIFKLTPSELMGQPYGQIVVMHAGLIFGAFAIEKLGSPIWLLVIIVLFKLVVDVVQHRRRHAQNNLAEQVNDH